MQKQDLGQIKQLFKDNNEILRKEIKDNNEVLLKKIDEKLDEKIDELASAVNQGFSELENKMNKKFLGVDKRFDQTDEKLGTLEKGHEEIRLRLDNVAYRFEVVELQKRVEVLEKKLNIQFSR